MATTIELPKGFELDEPISEDSQVNPPEGFTLDAPDISEPISAYTRYRPIIKSSLEGIFTGGGATVGGIAGGAAGSIVPFAGTAAGIAMGGATGATLGFAASQETMDILDNIFGVTQPEGIVSEIKELGAGLKAGAEIGFGGELIGPLAGQVIGRPLKFIKSKLPPLSRSGIQKKAGEILADVGTEATQPQIQTNVKIAKEIENKIPDLKFTRGQITNDAQAIALERSLARKGGADLNQEQMAFANDTIQKYYNSKLTATGKISDFTESLIAQREGLESTLKTSQQKIDAEVMRLNRVMDEQDLSRNLTTRLSFMKQGLKDEATKLYNKIPDVKLKTENLNKSIGDLIDAEDGLVLPKTKDMINLVLNKTRDEAGIAKNIGFQTLRKLRTRINRNISSTSSGATPDLEDARQLSILRDEVEETINQLQGDPSQAGKLFNEATANFKIYFGRFRQGKVADVLQKGRRGEETRIAMSNIAKEFFTKDGMDDFLRAVGDDEVAKEIMRDYSKYDLLNKAIDPQTGKLITRKVFQWINKNSRTLKKIGIGDEFKDIAQLQKNVDLNKVSLDKFNKSVASRFLNADIDGAVNAAFRGSKNTGSTAKELLDLTKGNKIAEEGLKKAFSENLLRESQTTGLDLLQNPIISVASLTRQIQRYSPAIRVLYRNEPQKIKAIADVQRAYRILNRTLKSPIGGGSDTAENIANAFVSVTAPIATSRFAVVNAIKALTRSFSQYSNDQVNHYLLKATFDPDYAISLINLAKNPSSQEAIIRMNELMVLPLLAGKNILESINELKQSHPEGSQSTLGGR